MLVLRRCCIHAPVPNKHDNNQGATKVKKSKKQLLNFLEKNISKISNFLTKKIKISLIFFKDRQRSKVDNNKKSKRETTKAN